MTNEMRGIAVAAVAGAVAFGVWWWVSSLGHQAIMDLARDRGLCGNEACIDGTMHIYTIAGEKYGLSPGVVDWCVGTDDVAATRVPRGGALKGPLVYVMRLPCGELGAD